MSISAYEEAQKYAAQQQQYDSVEQLLCVDILLSSRTQPALLSSFANDSVGSSVSSLYVSTTPNVNLKR